MFSPTRFFFYKLYPKSYQNITFCISELNRCLVGFFSLSLLVFVFQCRELVFCRFPITLELVFIGSQAYVNPYIRISLTDFFATITQFDTSPINNFFLLLGAHVLIPLSNNWSTKPLVWGVTSGNHINMHFCLN